LAMTNEQEFIGAAKAGNITLLVKLRQLVPVDTSDEIGNTALMYAAQEGYTEVVYLLLFWGADPNWKNKYNTTALMWASESGHQIIVEMLLANCAEVNAQNNAGHSALMLAAMRGHTRVVEILLLNGADRLLTTKENYTARGFAACALYNETVEAMDKFDREYASYRSVFLVKPRAKMNMAEIKMQRNLDRETNTLVQALPFNIPEISDLIREYSDPTFADFMEAKKSKNS